MDRRVMPVGVQDFEDLRRKGYIYVDKTEYVWNLANSSKSFFLSRPRRFGKSLFTSTLESYFRGRKDLFEGLYIYDKEKKSQTYNGSRMGKICIGEIADHFEVRYINLYDFMREQGIVLQ